MINGMALAEHMATESKDPSTKVGACILDKLGRVMGVGYNGFPRGIKDDARLDYRGTKYPITVHAEVNAILNSRGGCEGGSLYCTHFPCAYCAGPIIQSGIVKVIAPLGLAGWNESQLVALEMFEEAGVGVV